MKNIIFYARLVEIISYTLMPIIIMNLFIKWFFPEMFFSDHFIAGFFHGYQPDNPIITTMPLLHRLMAVIIDGVWASLLFMILWLMVGIMNHFQKNEPFSLSTVTLFDTISKFAFCLAIYAPISRSLLSIITTLHKTPHTLSISFGSSDLFNILIFGFFMIMMLLMQQGTSLQNEHNLTV